MKTFLEMRESLERQRAVKNKRFNQDRDCIAERLEAVVENKLEAAYHNSLEVYSLRAAVEEALDHYVTGPRYVYSPDIKKAAAETVSERFAVRGFHTIAFETAHGWEVSLNWS